ncbi:uncharacterized protein LOC106668873 isoform X6 [Cimex lectularius]|uniref:Uncharacterized protein n=1 Tax=Cimex lectularius TaxID=79782 RepID=A0A8I6SE48_CIMLE|nr:uncharacterized protein LOC106668873 isoform X6 [Cimex lectularius]
MEKKGDDLCQRKTGRSHLLNRRSNLQSTQSQRSTGSRVLFPYGTENSINSSILDGLTSIQSYASQPSTSKSPSHIPVYSNSSRSTNSGIGDRKESNERCELGSSKHTLSSLPIGHSSLSSLENKKQMNDEPMTEVCPKAAETIDGTRKELKELKQIILSHNNINHCRMQELISLMEVVVQKAHEVHSSNVKLKEQSIIPLNAGKDLDSHQDSIVMIEQQSMKPLAEKLLKEHEEAQKKLKHTLRLVQSPPLYSCDESVNSSEMDCDILTYNNSNCDDNFDNMSDNDMNEQLQDSYSSTCTDDQQFSREHPNYINNQVEVVSMYSICDRPSNVGMSDQQVVVNDSARNKTNKMGKNKVYNDFLAYKTGLQQESKKEKRINKPTAGRKTEQQQQVMDESQKVITMGDKMSSGRMPRAVPQKRAIGVRDGKSQKQKKGCDSPPSSPRGMKQAPVKQSKGKNKPTNVDQTILPQLPTICEDGQEMYYDQQAIYANNLPSQQMMFRGGKQKARKDLPAQQMMFTDGQKIQTDMSSQQMIFVGHKVQSEPICPETKRRPSRNITKITSKSMSSQQMIFVDQKVQSEKPKPPLPGKPKAVPPPPKVKEPRSCSPAIKETVQKPRSCSPKIKEMTPQPRVCSPSIKESVHSPRLSPPKFQEPKASSGQQLISIKSEYKPRSPSPAVRTEVGTSNQFISVPGIGRRSRSPSVKQPGFASNQFITMKPFPPKLAVGKNGKQKIPNDSSSQQKIFTPRNDNSQQLVLTGGQQKIQNDLSQQMIFRGGQQIRSGARSPHSSSPKRKEQARSQRVSPEKYDTAHGQNQTINVEPVTSPSSQRLLRDSVASLVESQRHVVGSITNMESSQRVMSDPLAFIRGHSPHFGSISSVTSPHLRDDSLSQLSFLNELLDPKMSSQFVTTDLPTHRSDQRVISKRESFGSSQFVTTDSPTHMSDQRVISKRESFGSSQFVTADSPTHMSDQRVISKRESFGSSQFVTTDSPTHMSDQRVISKRESFGSSQFGTTDSPTHRLDQRVVRESLGSQVSQLLITKDSPSQVSGHLLKESLAQVSDHQIGKAALSSQVSFPHLSKPSLHSESSIPVDRKEDHPIPQESVHHIPKESFGSQDQIPKRPFDSVECNTLNESFDTYDRQVPKESFASQVPYYHTNKDSDAAEDTYRTPIGLGAISPKLSQTPAESIAIKPKLSRTPAEPAAFTPKYSLTTGDSSACDSRYSRTIGESSTPGPKHSRSPADLVIYDPMHSQIPVESSTYGPKHSRSPADLVIYDPMHSQIPVESFTYGPKQSRSPGELSLRDRKHSRTPGELSIHHPKHSRTSGELFTYGPKHSRSPGELSLRDRKRSRTPGELSIHHPKHSRTQGELAEYRPKHSQTSVEGQRFEPISRQTPAELLKSQASSQRLVKESMASLASSQRLLNDSVYNQNVYVPTKTSPHESSPQRVIVPSAKAKDKTSPRKSPKFRSRSLPSGQSDRSSRGIKSVFGGRSHSAGKEGRRSWSPPPIPEVSESLEEGANITRGLFATKPGDMDNQHISVAPKFQFEDVINGSGQNIMAPHRPFPVDSATSEASDQTALFGSQYITPQDVESNQTISYNAGQQMIVKSISSSPDINGHKKKSPSVKVSRVGQYLNTSKQKQKKKNKLTNHKMFEDSFEGLNDAKEESSQQITHISLAETGCQHNMILIADGLSMQTGMLQVAARRVVVVDEDLSFFQGTLMDSAFEISNAITAGADAYIRSESLVGNGTQLVSVVDLQDGNCYIKKQGILQPDMEYPQEEDKLVNMESDLRPTFYDLVKMGYQEFSKGDYGQNKALLINSPNLTEIISGYEVKNIELERSSSHQQFPPFGSEGDTNPNDFEHYNNGELLNQLNILPYDHEDTVNAGDFYYVDPESADEKPPLGEFSGQIDKAPKKSANHREAVGQVDHKVKKSSKIYSNSQQVIIRPADSQQMIIRQEPKSSFRDTSSQHIINSPKISVSGVASRISQLDELSSCSSETQQLSYCSSTSGSVQLIQTERRTPEIEVPLPVEAAEQFDSNDSDEEEYYVSATDDVLPQNEPEETLPDEDSIDSFNLMDEEKEASPPETAFEVERGTNVMAPITSEESLPDVVHDKSVQGEPILGSSSSETNIRDHDSQQMIAEISKSSQNLIILNNASPRTYHVNQLRKISRHQPKEYRFKIVKK